jgi:hypothetical protein
MRLNGIAQALRLNAGSSHPICHLHFTIGVLTDETLFHAGRVLTSRRTSR